MEYDRVQIKLAAKAKIRRGDPKPWLVTLIYLLLTSVPSCVLSFFLTMATSALSIFVYRHSAYYASEHLAFLPFLFLNILISLFAVVLGTGYQHWSMKLWRGQRTEAKDLFRCFPMAGKVILLYLLILAFTLLWMLAALFVGMIPVSLLLWIFDSEFLASVITFLAIVGWTAFLYNRILLYSMMSLWQPQVSTTAPPELSPHLRRMPPVHRPQPQGITMAGRPADRTERLPPAVITAVS